jgi:hypothetical protein
MPFRSLPATTQAGALGDAIHEDAPGATIDKDALGATNH